MFPCCAYDPNFLLFAMDKDGIEPAPDHSALTVSVALLALVWTVGLAMAVS
ncbi:hypothetical protein [Paracoccus onubensis]|uniref:hypothetical protein n=1 Tax=Paracoccus onubensis TaxID=1675788 RepID=UPI001602D50D|nr:hypothetical protein [Paracoccus onubensis]